MEWKSPVRDRDCHPFLQPNELEKTTARKRIFQVAEHMLNLGALEMGVKQWFALPAGAAALSVIKV